MHVLNAKIWPLQRIKTLSALRLKFSILSTIKGQIVNFSNGVCIDYFTTYC